MMYTIIAIRNEEGIAASNIAHGPIYFSDKRYKVLFQGILKANKCDGITITRLAIIIENACKFVTTSAIGYEDNLQTFQMTHYFQLNNIDALIEEVNALRNSLELRKSNLIALRIINQVQAEDGIKTFFPCVEHRLLAR